MFGPLCGGPEDIPGAPASRAVATGFAAAGRGGAARRLRRRRILGRNEPTGTYHVKVTEASFPTEQELGQTSLLRLGVRNSGKQDRPGLTVTLHDRRQGRARLLAAVRRPRPAGRTSPSPTGRSGCSPQTYPQPARLLRARRRHDLEPQDLRLRAAEARRDDRRGLEAERRAGRASTPCSTASTPGSAAKRKAKTDGGVAPGGSFVAEITSELPRNRSHRQRRNRRNPEAERAKPAVASRRCDALRSRRSLRSSRRRPAARPATCGSAAGGREQDRAATAAASGGVALKRIGSFDSPVYVTGAPGFPEAALRRRAARAGSSVLQRRPQARQALPRHLAAWSPTAASAACSRSPSRPTTRSSGRFYVYYTDNAGQHPHRRIQARAARPAPAPGSRRAGDRDPPPGQRQPQRRPAAVPRRPPLLRHRRRRLRRRPAEQRPEQGRPARQAAADRPAPAGGQALLGAALATPSSASRAATRSTATACATRSASPSTR